MNDKTQNLQSKWEKGAIAGGVWGTAELLLGSFLHNFKVPLKGYIMATIGVTLLSGINAEWRQKGLFFRAGLTAAMLKFFSPSHKIINPAIAISIEGACMEAGQLLLGSNPVGFAVGGSLAMLYTLMHKFFRLYLVFGANIYILYARFMESTAAVSGLKHITPWAGIAVIVIIYLIWGMAFSFLGYSIGKNAKKHRNPITYIKSIPSEEAEGSHADEPRTLLPEHSFAWMAAVFAAAVLTFMYSLHNSPVIPVLLIFSVYAASRYRKILRKFLKVRIWLPVFAISFLSGAVIYSGDEGWLSIPALAGGVRMLFRAYFMMLFISGFTYELGHPAIKKSLHKRYGDVIDTAMKTAFETKAAVEPIFANKEFAKNPISSLRSVLNTAHSFSGDGFADIILVTGGINTGKTAFMKKEAERLKQFGVCGFIAQAGQLSPVKDLYAITDINNGRSMLFCRRDENGKFIFFEDALKFGSSAVRDNLDSSKYVFIDEAGQQELNGEGWSTLIRDMMSMKLTLVISVRNSLLNEFIRTFDIKRPLVIDVAGKRA